MFTCLTIKYGDEVSCVLPLLILLFRCLLARQVGKSSACLGLLGSLIKLGYTPHDLAYIKPATQCEQRTSVVSWCEAHGISCQGTGYVQQPSSLFSCISNASSTAYFDYYLFCFVYYIPLLALQSSILASPEHSFLARSQIYTYIYIHTF